jgi:hypothetical protein
MSFVMILDIHLVQEPEKLKEDLAGTGVSVDLAAVHITIPTR